MKKQICICDHCGAQFNPINGYSDMEIDDFDFIKEVDLCTDCYKELCDIIRDFIHEDTSRQNFAFKGNGEKDYE